MAINYTPVGWDISDYVNPTNMNQMDSGIKAACDGVDKLEKDIANTNSNLSKIQHGTAVTSNNGSALVTLPTPYADTNYTVICTLQYTDASVRKALASAYIRTTNTFSVYAIDSETSANIEGAKISWMAIGN